MGDFEEYSVDTLELISIISYLERYEEIAKMKVSQHNQLIYLIKKLRERIYHE